MNSMFAVNVNLWELFIRGSCMYLGIFALMRILRRQKGALNAADMLVLIIVADAAQNAMSAEYKSITEGAVLVGTIFFWDFLIDVLAFRIPFVYRMVNPSPLALIIDGEFQRKNLRSEMLTKDDVLEQLREQGVDEVSDVKRCTLEGDGHFSVIKRGTGEGARR